VYKYLNYISNSNNADASTCMSLCAEFQRNRPLQLKASGGKITAHSLLLNKSAKIIVLMFECIALESK
jgi:hypothetical protein